MTQLSNEPNLERTTMTDAVIERPQTLIEKLEQKRDHHNHFLETCRNDRDKAYHSFGKKCYQEAINIVKQHSDWIPVSELPKEEKDWLVRFRKEDGFGLTMAVSKFYLEAQRFDCFHSKVTHYMELPKPPSEVQDD